MRSLRVKGFTKRGVRHNSDGEKKVPHPKFLHWFSLQWSQEIKLWPYKNYGPYPPRSDY